MTIDVHEVASFDPLNDLRMRLLEHIAKTHLTWEQGEVRPALVVITHMLTDRPALLTVLSSYFDIKHVFAIPYSTNREVASWTARHFPMTEPSLADLNVGSCLVEKMKAAAALSSGVVLFEIGGYGARHIPRLSEEIRGRLLGVVEGTASGYERYSKVPAPKTPIVAMSLSPIKAAECALVGSAALFSIERVIRSIGLTNEVRTVLIIGYGRVGKSAAQACRSRNMDVYVYDINPIQRVQALADGFLVSDRAVALSRADLVLGTTGHRSWTASDALHMNDGAFLASTSSRDVEFEFDELKRSYPTHSILPGLDSVTVADRRLHFLYEGQPVNFRDGANLGPILALLQAQIVVSLGALVKRALSPGVQAPDITSTEELISAWSKVFLDESIGWYRRRTI